MLAPAAIPPWSTQRVVVEVGDQGGGYAAVELASKGHASSSDEPPIPSESDEDSGDASSSPDEAPGNGSMWTRYFGKQRKLFQRKAVEVVRQNPFENEAPWTRYEVFKLIFVGLTLFPVRLLLLIVISLFLLLLTFVASIGVTMDEDRGCFRQTTPIAIWRRLLLKPVALLNRGILWCLGFWCIRITDERSDDSVTPNVIVAAPHFAPTDPALIAWAFPPVPAGVGDAKILRAPCFGSIAKVTQGIFFKVADRSSRAACKEAIAARADPAWQGPPLMIFPEGRITNGQMLIQFKWGAFYPGQPVQPVGLRYPYRYYDPAWTGKNRSCLWPLRMMTQFVNHCEVILMDPYCPSEDEKSNPALFCTEVRELIAEELGLATTEHTYDDAALYRAAQKAKCKTDFEVDSMRAVFDVDLSQLLEWLNRFKAIDVTSDGVIDRGEFEAILELGDTREAQLLFDFFDTDSSGFIEYREFVQCLAMLSGRCSDQTMLQVAFIAYDHDGSGRVRVRDLRKALQDIFATPAPELAPPPVPASLRQSRVQVSSRLSSRRSNTTGDLATSMTKGSMCSYLASRDDSDELNFEEFCRLVRSEPGLLEAAIARMRKNLSGA